MIGSHIAGNRLSHFEYLAAPALMHCVGCYRPLLKVVIAFQQSNSFQHARVQGTMESPGVESIQRHQNFQFRNPVNIGSIKAISVLLRVTKLMDRSS